MAEGARSMGGGDTDVGLVKAPLGAAKNNLIRVDGRMHSGAMSPYSGFPDLRRIGSIDTANRLE